MSRPEPRPQSSAAGPVGLRREPPRFRQAAVRRVERLSPRMVRVTLGGAELEGLAVPDPAASVRVLLPSPGASQLVVPGWNGNEFLLPDGRRPIIRTLTPRRVEARALELDVDIVLHAGGAASEWATVTEPGWPVAVSGPGRGYAIESDARAFFVAGDETAIPAISQLLETLPGDKPVRIHIEISVAEAQLALPAHAMATIDWQVSAAGHPPGDSLVDASRAAEIQPGTRIWVAGEAAAMQRVRRCLFEERGLTRGQATIRGYWKHGRAGDTRDDG